MVINKKKIIASAIAGIVIVGGVGITSHTVTANADNISYQQAVEEAKEDLQNELDEKYTKELEEKENKTEDLQKQLDDANSKIEELQTQQQSTNNSESSSAKVENSNAVDKSYVDNTVNKAKEETQEKADDGDKQVESKINYDTINEKRNEELKQNPPEEAPVEEKKQSKDK